MNGKRLLAFLLVIAVTFGLIGWTSPMLMKNTRLGLDLKGGFEILYVASPIEAGKPVNKDSLIQTAHSIEDRANKQGVAEPDVTTEGNDRIRVKLAGVANQDQLRKTLSEPAQLTFRAPDGTIVMNGSDFVENAASIVFDSSNLPLVQIKVKDPNKLKDVTTKLLNQRMSIFLNDQDLYDPTVRNVIDNGSAVISGYDLEKATEIKNNINLGALPLKLTEKYVQSVGATLGQQSLVETVRASIIGSIIILLFMIAFYRLPGVVASIGLITYTWMLLGVMVLMNATLTLPGIAAFVLGVGMAVDANIITYERIKDEIRNGKSVLSSLKSGSKNSFRTIIDAHVTTIIAGAVLYFIGTGSVKGFALTLIFSILVNLFTNVFFSRWLLQILVRANILKKPTYFGVKESEIHAL